MLAFEYLQLNLQGGGARHRAGAKAKVDLVQRVGLARRIGKGNQTVSQLLERRLRNVGVIVPDDAGAGGFLDGGAKSGMIVAPEHLVMARGAIQEQAALFAQIKKSAPD